MKYTENALNILTAKSFKNIGSQKIVDCYRKEDNIITIVNKLRRFSSDNITVEEFEKRKNKIRNIFEKNNLSADGVVALGDKNFPQVRGDVEASKQPVCLFYKGNIELLNINNPCVAVIGLLTPDINIEKRETKVVSELVKKGITIVSGLALGCDTIAHNTALKFGGKTVAILPSPLHNILPKENKRLSEEIVSKGGLLISEYYEDFSSVLELRGRYEMRDRLQALFSNAVVLSASYAQSDKGKDSGSRLAMRDALKYNIKRAVIYNEDMDKDNPMYNLSRQVLSEKDKTIIINGKTLESSINEIANIRPNVSSQEFLF